MRGGTAIFLVGAAFASTACAAISGLNQLELEGPNCDAGCTDSASTSDIDAASTTTSQSNDAGQASDMADARPTPSEAACPPAPGSAVPKLDIVDTLSFAPSPLRANQAIVLTIQVANDGSAISTGGIGFGVYESGARVGGADPGGEAVPPGIHVTLTGAVTPLAAGTHELTIIIDDQRLVCQVDRSGGTRAATVDVLP